MAISAAKPVAGFFAPYDTGVTVLIVPEAVIALVTGSEPIESDRRFRTIESPIDGPEPAEK